MKLAHILNYASYATVGLVFIVSGFIETTVLSIYGRGIANDLPDHPLPELTLFALASAKSHTLVMFGIVTGLGFSCLLFVLDRGTERRRAHITVFFCDCIYRLLVSSTHRMRGNGVAVCIVGTLLKRGFRVNRAAIPALWRCLSLSSQALRWLSSTRRSWRSPWLGVRSHVGREVR